MARKPKNEISQAQFVREALAQDKTLTVSGTKEAWAKAGYKGELNQTIFYLERKKLGLATGKPRKGKKPGRKPGKKNAAAEAAPDAHFAPAAKAAKAHHGGHDGYHDIERALDHLIAKAEGLHDHKLADELRQARRQVSKHLA